MRRNNSINVYQYGNTVRLECTFHEFNGSLVDPDNVKITVYDSRYNKIFEGNGIRIETGKYFFDYTTEEKEQKCYYEWYGEIEGKPSLKRGEFMTRFV